jgi:hypothetical protein
LSSDGIACAVLIGSIAALPAPNAASASAFLQPTLAGSAILLLVRMSK